MENLEQENIIPEEQTVAAPQPQPEAQLFRQVQGVIKADILAG